MPAYNVEKYIAETIESVLKQTYRDFELIIINDGSTDGTLDIIRKYAEADSRIQFINIANGGVAKARNIGIDYATGEYISFLDADDLWVENFLEAMYDWLQMTKARLCYCRYHLLMQDGSERDNGVERFPEGNLEAFFVKSEIRLPMHICGIMISRWTIEKHKILFVPKRSLHEDIEFLYKVLLLNKTTYLAEDLLAYRQRESSASHQSWSLVKAKQEIAVYTGLRKFARNNVPDMIDKITAIANYKIYRFILGCIKKDHINEAVKLIEKYHVELTEFAAQGLKWNERLKCRLFLLKNKTVLRIIG